MAQGAVSAVCATHHASEDFRTARDVEPTLGGGEEDRTRTRLPAFASTTSIEWSRRIVDRAVRRHVRVGVWRE